jgi:hypothetical protein
MSECTVGFDSINDSLYTTVVNNEEKLKKLILDFKQAEMAIKKSKKRHFITKGRNRKR